MDIDRLLVEITPILKTAIRQACRRYHYSPGWDEIEDLSQGIILGLIKNNYRRLRMYDQQHSLQTWLAVIARHYLCDYLRRQSPTVSLADVASDGSLIIPSSQEKNIIYRQRCKNLYTILSGLSKKDQLLFELICLGLSTQEIAKYMKIQPASVRRRKYILIKKVRRRLGELDG